MINARGWIVLAFVVAGISAISFQYGERQERSRWNYWTATTVAWESKGDRLK